MPIGRNPREEAFSTATNSSIERRVSPNASPDWLNTLITAMPVTYSTTEPFIRDPAAW
ncbi:MAG: hypothetical protein ACR2IP_04275 [Solirubrobacteraceae bacterium]